MDQVHIPLSVGVHDSPVSLFELAHEVIGPDHHRGKENIGFMLKYCGQKLFVAIVLAYGAFLILF